jgi:hypothetical protein
LEPAIKKLVQFLEQHYDQPKARTNTAIRDRSSKDVSHAILQVITGTGSHSTSAGGPVLKYAVNDFLHRHSFQYTYHSKSGYFVIPIYNNTGVLSYQSHSCSVSTKIIIKSPCAIDKTFGNSIKKSRTIENHGLKSEQRELLIPTMELPTLQEVVLDEKELQRGVDESLEEYRKRQKEYAKEQKLYQEAIQVSNEEIRKLEEEEKLILERVVQESVELSERENDDIEVEEIALKQAILESLEGSEHNTNNGGIESEDDDNLLQRVIMESKALHDASERYDDDDLLQRAIVESEKYL